MVSAESRRTFEEDDLVFAATGTPGRDAVGTRACTPSARRPRKRCRRACPRAAADHAGWALASVDAAGDTTVDVGGDYFDVVELDKGFLAVVGDVTGKGVQAAALTALARHTLATAARFDPARRPSSAC